MRHGTRWTHADERDYSARSFGAISVPDLPLEFSVDNPRQMPDQNALSMPMGCTGFTQADIAGTEDRLAFDPSYTYEKTCFMEGHDPDEGCDVRNSLESERIYGLYRLDVQDDPLRYRRGAYFQIWPDRGMDYFDNVRATIFQTKRGVSVGTPWFPSWQQRASGEGAIMPPFVYNGRPNEYPWHNYAIVGWKVIKGVQYLVAKPWQGPLYGDRGYVYFPREVINAALAINGTSAWTIAKYKPEDVLTIKLSLLRWAWVYLARLISLKLYN